MAFDLDAYRAAHDPWSFTAHGRTFVAQPVSAHAYRHACERLEAKRIDENGFALELLRIAFPWRVHYYWRKDLDPVEVVQRLTLDEYHAVVLDFLAFLGVPMTGRPVTLGTR